MREIVVVGGWTINALESQLGISFVFGGRLAVLPGKSGRFVASSLRVAVTGRESIRRRVADIPLLPQS